MSDLNAETEYINKIADATPFSKMDGGQKISYLGRMLGFLVTFGFLFPNVFLE